MVGRGNVMNVGRGYVIQNSQSVNKSVSDKGKYRATKAAKKDIHHTGKQPHYV